MIYFKNLWIRTTQPRKFKGWWHILLLFLSSPPQSPLAITPVETKSTAQMVRSEREKTASSHKLRMLQGLPLPWEGDTLFPWTLLGPGAKGRGWCAGYPFDGMRRQFDTTFRFFPSSASGSNRIKTFVCCLHIFVWLSLLTALRLLVLCLICSRHAGSLNSAGLLSVKYFSSPSPSLVINCSWPQILQGTYHSPPTVIVHLFWSSMNDRSGFIMWYCR